MSTGSLPSVRLRLRSGLTAALKAKDRTSVSVLRSALAAIDDAEAVPLGELPEGRTPAHEHVAGGSVGVGSSEVPRRELDEEGALAVLDAEIRERLITAEEYERLGRPEHAAGLRAEAQILRRYAPR